MFSACSLLCKGPFTLAIFAASLAAIFAAISWRFQIARVNYWRFRGDLNRQWFTQAIWNRREIALEIAAKVAAKIAAKIASVNGPLPVVKQ